jgi:hypothetical protein
MNQITKENLREQIVSTINQFSPEYVELSEESNEMIDLLVNSIENFDEECENDPKQEAIAEQTEDSINYLKNS